MSRLVRERELRRDVAEGVWCLMELLARERFLTPLT